MPCSTLLASSFSIGTTALISLLAFALFFFPAHQLSEIVQTNRKEYHEKDSI
jgi:hypothetical protein